MTVELGRFSLQDVPGDWKLMVLFFLIGLMILSLMCGFVYANIASFRAKKISRLETDKPPAFIGNKIVDARVFKHDCVRRPMMKAVMFLLLAFAMGIVTLMHWAIFLSQR